MIFKIAKDFIYTNKTKFLTKVLKLIVFFLLKTSNPIIHNITQYNKALSFSIYKTKSYSTHKNFTKDSKAIYI